MVDVVLGSLMRSAGYAQRARIGARSRARVLARRERCAPRPRRSTTTAADPVSVSISMRVGIGPSWRPALKTERRADRDRSSCRRRMNGDWCTWPHSTMRGPVLLDPRDEVLVAVVALARSSSSATRRVARGTPRSTADRRPVLGVRGELTVDDVAGARAVPPRADGHRRHPSRFEACPVDEDARGARRCRATPRRRSSCSLRRVEVVVARARDDGRLRRDAREVLEHHGDLRVRARRSTRCRGDRRRRPRGRSRPRPT